MIASQPSPVRLLRALTCSSGGARSEGGTASLPIGFTDPGADQHTIEVRWSDETTAIWTLADEYRMQTFTQNYLRAGGTTAFSEYYKAEGTSARIDRLVPALTPVAIPR